MIIHGDNIEVMRTLPENCVDAIVTDPPYGLSFMGRQWDYDVPSVAFWTEAIRVLKPGGHALVFGGTRTYHRVAVNIEDAGFEIRDSIHWMYGKGFPKSLNLGGEHKGWGTALKPGHEPIVVARKPLDGTTAQNVAKWGTGALNIDGCRVKPIRSLVDEHGRWPPNVVFTHSAGCRKVGERVIASNWHSAAFYSNTAVRGTQYKGFKGRTGLVKRETCCEVVAKYDCVDGCPVALLDQQTGSPDGTVVAEEQNRANKCVHQDRCILNGVDASTPYGKNPGASRIFPSFELDENIDDLTPFIYCAKASRPERDAGCEHLPARSGADAVNRKAGSAGLNSPRAGAGRNTESVLNHHPTVKPVALMRWLVRLVTPPGGVVLDPFCGSGTTIVAATLEGFSGIGMELDAEYVAIAEARVAHAAKSM